TLPRGRHGERDGTKLSFCFFFFQAEDGIRGKLVTGVQTCALPIWNAPTVEPQPQDNARRIPRDEAMKMVKKHKAIYIDVRPKDRSEERRVGKECRSRWSAGDREEKSATKRRSGWGGGLLSCRIAVR